MRIYPENEQKTKIVKDQMNAQKNQGEYNISTKIETEPLEFLKPTEYKTLVSESNCKILESEEKIRQSSRNIPKQRK